MASESTKKMSLGSLILTTFFVVTIGVPTGCWALDRWWPDPEGSRLERMVNSVKRGSDGITVWWSRQALRGHLAEVRARKAQLVSDIETFKTRIAVVEKNDPSKAEALRSVLQKLVSEKADLIKLEDALVAAEADDQVKYERRELDRTRMANNDAEMKHMLVITEFEATSAAQKTQKAEDDATAIQRAEDELREQQRLGRKESVTRRINTYLDLVKEGKKGGKYDQAEKLCSVGVKPTATQYEQLIRLDPAGQMGLLAEGGNYKVYFGDMPVLLMMEKNGEWYVGAVLVPAATAKAK